MRTQLALVVAAGLSFVASCDKAASQDPAPKVDKAADERAPASKLVDLSTSLTAAREAFNAHKGEARFLTLLSPT